MSASTRAKIKICFCTTSKAAAAFLFAIQFVDAATPTTFSSLSKSFVLLSPLLGLKATVNEMRLSKRLESGLFLKYLKSMIPHNSIDLLQRKQKTVKLLLHKSFH